MQVPPLHRAAAACFLLALFGCATLRSPEPPPATGTRPLSREAMQALADSTASESDAAPRHRVYHHFHAAFLALQANRLEEAALALDRATLLLTGLVSENGSDLPAVRLAGLVRVALELHRDLLAPTAPLSPKSTLAYLLDALPGSILTRVQDHPYYSEFYVRKLAGAADVPVDYNPEVRKSIRYFQTDGRETFKHWLSRSGVYAPMIREALREAGLPEDLVYKAMIESGFNPRAYSRARAAGIWQFVGATAPLYGLRRNTWVDERRDPEKSTRAALKHIRHLYGLFGDWRLVIAAYNCGQGRLERAIKKSGTRNFWALRDLPGETRTHVPRFMAALIISKDPAWFGFDDVVYRPPLNYDTVQVTECVDLRVAAECAGASYEVLRDLNPELRAGYTPPPTVSSAYDLRVPAGTAGRFLANYARVPDHRKVRMVDYRVRYGDTVSGIARRLGVSTRAVLDANGIRNPRNLRAGKRLKIPIRPGRNPGLADVQPGAALPGPAAQEKVIYRVRSGDTLWDIGRREGVTPDQLLDWNSLPSARAIRPGDRLVIWRPGSGPAAASGGKGAPGGYYVVQPGDTLWDIARAFRTSVGDLKRWNRIQRPARLQAGARLLVRPPDDLQEAD